MMAAAAHGRALRREELRVALDVWARRRRERLEREPEEVRAEILSAARERLECSGGLDWSERDNELCRMRVLSRMRLRRHGAIPDGREWLRQIEALREQLGLARREAAPGGAP